MKRNEDGLESEAVKRAQQKLIAEQTKKYLARSVIKVIPSDEDLFLKHKTLDMFPEFKKNYKSKARSYGKSHASKQGK